MLSKFPYMKKNLNVEICYLYYIAELLCLVQNIVQMLTAELGFGKALGCSRGFVLHVLCAPSPTNTLN